MKPFTKRDKRTDGRTDGRTDAQTDMRHFIISRPGPIGRREIITNEKRVAMHDFTTISDIKIANKTPG